MSHDAAEAPVLAHDDLATQALDDKEGRVLQTVGGGGDVPGQDDVALPVAFELHRSPAGRTKGHRCRAESVAGE